MASLASGAGMADKMERKGERAGGPPRAAARHDWAIEAHSRFVEQKPQLLGAPQLPGLRVGDPVERHIAAAGDMAAPPPGPGLFDGAVEAAGRPCLAHPPPGPGEAQVPQPPPPFPPPPPATPR